MYGMPEQYSPIAPYETPHRRRGGLVRVVRFVLPLPLVLFALAFFGGTYLLMPEPDAEVHPGVAFARVEGRPAVLVPYDLHGSRGMFQLVVRDMFQVRLAAVDTASGELLWDAQLSDELAWEASVLAAGDRYAYLATTSGLVVVSLADGSVVAGAAEVVGDAHLTARTAYGYDAETRRVMALDANGGVLAVPLDTLAAVPAEPGPWAGRLSPDSAPPPPPPTATAVRLGQEAVGLHDLPVGAALVRLPGEVPLGGTAFHGAALVTEATPAGHVLVQHRPSVNDAGTALSAVSLATGLVTGTVGTGSPVARALTGPDGGTAVVTGDEVVLARPDGSLSVLDVGSTDFFGNPS
ncbi:PA2928 family protein [Saccharothrix sp. Mg75]|uniref:PA2928 family protein n=1 Tax=Saccharothrix sp. Mg75 TaxID=3445357 RepID=UPI003EECE29D